MIGVFGVSIVLSVLLAATTSHAQTWVASSGSDSGTCGTRASPCRSFTQALTRTNSTGEILCADSANYGGLTITKSITVNCEGVVASLHLPPSSSAVGSGSISVNISASDLVILRGLDVDQGAQFQNTTTGISFGGAGTLILQRMKVTNAQSNTFGTSYSGFVFAPTGAGKLVIEDSLFAGNGFASSGAGIRIVPQGSGSAQVSIERVTLSGNTFGIAVDGSGSSGGINATISDSVASANFNDGIVATSSNAPIGVTVINSRSLNNAFGIRSIGGNVTVRVKDSSIIGNGVGLSGGGALISGGNNTVQGNASNGGFTGSYALQ